jgi:predicted signal transduction protein with EAL and GGDEF domain
MGPLDVLHHALNFVAPAAALAVLLVLGGRFIRSKGAQALSWKAQIAINFVVGCAVLVAGLVVLGRDGKMLTYAALVLACASCQWSLVRGWRP